MDLDEIHSLIQQTTLEIRQQVEIAERCKNVYLHVTRSLQQVAAQVVASEEIIRKKTAYLGELIDIEKKKIAVNEASAVQE